MHIELASPTDVGDFRARSNALLANQVHPSDIDWHASESAGSGTQLRDGVAHSPPSSALRFIVPRSFARLTELVVLHRGESRFKLLYRLLWRLVHEPELAAAHGDSDMALAQSMAQAVRRDVQKQRRTVQLRVLAPLAGVALACAWTEPQHRVTELVAAWLTRQEPTPPWVLASPDRSVLWTGRHLLCGPGVPAAQGRAMDDAQWHDLAARLAST
jgi:DNA polymerase